MCSALNMDPSEQRKRLSEEFHEKITNNHVKVKDCKTISKRLYVPVTITANITNKYKVFMIKQTSQDVAVRGNITPG